MKASPIKDWNTPPWNPNDLVSSFPAKMRERAFWYDMSVCLHQPAFNSERKTWEFAIINAERVFSRNKDCKPLSYAEVSIRAHMNTEWNG